MLELLSDMRITIYQAGPTYEEHHSWLKEIYQRVKTLEMEHTKLTKAKTMTDEQLECTDRLITENS